MNNLSEILDFVLKIIKEAGDGILAFYDSNYKTEEKRDGSPITKADIESNRIILSALRKKFPDYGILSEEEVDNLERLKKKRVWIIDPLDGTRDFIEKTEDFTIMIGLVEEGRPILGIIYQPLKKAFYYAILGKGAFLKYDNKLKNLRVSSQSNISDAKMASSRFHLSSLEERFKNNLKIKKFEKRGSSLKVCRIAQGEADFNFNPANKTWEWDVCASDIILSEAGGKLSDIKGEIIKYNKKDPRNSYGYLASNNILHETIIKNLDL